MKYILWALLRQSKLKLNERITLSWLIYRSRFGGASVSWLADKSGFTRVSVRGHLKTLAELRYAEKKTGKWYPLEHASFVFRKVESKNPNPFHRKFCFKKLPLWTMKNRAFWVFFTLVLSDDRMLNKTHTYRGLGSMLGCNRETIKKVVNLATIEDSGFEKKRIKKNGKIIGIQFLKRGG